MLKKTDSFKRFFEAFYPSLCMVANHYLKDEAGSADVAQDAFIYIWDRKERFTDIASAKSYLYQYVRTRCLNLLRDTKCHREILNEKMEEKISFRDILIEQETFEIIYRAINKLSPRARQVIELALDGLSNKEIAETINVTVNTVKTVKKRAFSSLRNSLGKSLLSSLVALLI